MLWVGLLKFAVQSRLEIIQTDWNPYQFGSNQLLFNSVSIIQFCSPSVSSVLWKHSKPQIQDKNKQVHSQTRQFPVFMQVVKFCFTAKDTWDLDHTAPFDTDIYL